MVRQQKKKCSGCREYKPASSFRDFGKYPNGKLQLASKCNDCLCQRTPTAINPKICPVCGGEFFPANPLQKYCGYSCQNVGTNKQIKKKPTTTEIALKEFENNKKEMREAMMEEFGFLFCTMCKKSNARQYHFHHIIFRSEKPSHPMIHCKRNLIHVCDECHDLFHHVKGTRNEIVVERWLDKIFGEDVLNK